MEGLVEAEVEEAAAVLWTLPQPEVEVVVGLKVLKRAALAVGEGTSCLEGVEEQQHQAWKEVAVEVQQWELLKVVGEEPLFHGQEGEEGLSYEEGEEEGEVLPLRVEEVVVLAFEVHF